MVMSWIFTGITAVSIFCAFLTGRGSALSYACLQGAQAGIELSIAIAGSLCLWSGVGALLKNSGISTGISRCLRPLLYMLFPSSRKDSVLSQALSGNIIANFLGLGNAATPMGIQAAKRMNRNGIATDELCRLIVMNTASIQLIPTNVAAVRSALGCGTPFDILPSVWLTSLFSVTMGLTAAWLFGRRNRS